MADKTILARRAAARQAASPSIRTLGRPGSDLLARDLTPVNVRGYAGRHKNNRPGSDKGQGEWRSVSANDKTGRIGSGWDHTTSTMPRGAVWNSIDRKATR